MTKHMCGMYRCFMPTSASASAKSQDRHAPDTGIISILPVISLLPILVIPHLFLTVLPVLLILSVIVLIIL